VSTPLDVIQRVLGANRKQRPLEQLAKRAALVAVAAICGVATPVHAQSFKVGSFTKSVTTAVTVQAGATSTSSNGTTSLTIAAFDPGSNLNRLLVVGLSTAGAPTGVSVTYGGVALTLATGTSVTNGSTHTEIWYLVNPSSTAADIVATWTGSVAAVLGAVAFNNVDQTTPIAGGVTATGASTKPSVTIASRTGDMVLAVAAKLTNLGSEPATSQWHVSAAGQSG